MIAKGADPKLMFSELLGKAAGYCKGKGGSMHIAEPDLGMLGANAIVGAGTAIINGAALTAQYLGTNQVAVAFFGDGASNTGAFHEAMNMAAVWKLPTIFVCENNAYAESTPQTYHQTIEEIAVRAVGYGMPSASVDGNDAGAVYLAAKEAVARARRGAGPTLVEAKTYRIRGHYEGDPQIYRPKEEVEAWEKKCPVEHWRTVLLDRGISGDTIEEIDSQIDRELKEAVAFAEESPLPSPTEARSDIFTPLPTEMYHG